MIKKYRRLLIFVFCTLFCIGTVCMTMQVTAEYPALGVSVSYPVNQISGVNLTIQKLNWSPFKGYTIQWAVKADSKEVYFFTDSNKYLERCINGQWYRLERSQNDFSFHTVAFSLGGDTTQLQGSIIQKYAYYGTRLETGKYRIVLEMKAQNGADYYLTEEFYIE